MRTNWARTVRFSPASFRQPLSIAQVQEILDQPGKVRVIGAGHSFTPVAATDGTLINLDRLSGLVRVDRVSHRARFLGGTRLRDIPALLAPYGLALPNQGDVNPQSIAGAISTGTHGTGLGFTGFSGMVTGVSVLGADGRLRTVDDNDPDMGFHRLHLGLLGIIVEVELQCVPAFDLIAQEESLAWDDAVETIIDRAGKHDHVEFYWFPHTPAVLLKTNTRVPLGEATPEELATIGPRNRLEHVLTEEVLDNGALWLACEIGSRFPSAVPAINRAATRLASGRSYRAPAHEVFVSPRRVRFREMEYGVPLEEGPRVLRNIRSLIDRSGWRVSFPLEVRISAGDDVPLSTAYGRPTMYIAVHRYIADPYRDYFAGVEEIVAGAGGRPHWGKLHRLSYRDLASRYDRFDEFADAVREADPQRRFTNPYLDRLLSDNSQA
ncbi:D-arabinono-1,4-lactone oxidase [Flaviflexus equikiangi]|uniref:FAD-binding protein n=1 Tax=Flaviflexus equikiangi TaxID=2758573 RepID=A0ABS2TH76_9ACTO|nr:D-arabinono-1,4-lactone oxidase [Flaviflexus equikiangi]MBM9434018.1 FAD-binding protein [Flaviflexus equikiangi]